ncbi:unnamed protein product [Rhizoctonia solani]|uniref:F-box domain-containing protein n=1 Tax=Rhizoctonia solani TaxID=456999 RepID=A0A8H3BIY9_9AGAM|nr:unnamed protein product [Rhizoctonia solani]
MKLPAEVFMELASHIHPGGLVSLIRANKFFRVVLLNRSAAYVWQLSLSNVPELPPCPTAMVEPQYAALIFSDNCTLCGVQVASVLDPYLRVRLCPNYRDEQLISWSFDGVRTRYGIPFTQHTKPTSTHGNESPHYQLRAENELTERVESEFRRNGDEEGLAKWCQRRHLDGCTLCDEGDEILKYIYSVSDSPPKELNAIKLERRDEIHKRLKDQGWDQKYLNFYRRSGHTIKKWHSLVEIPEPLTEQTWTDILPKLTELLRENRQRLDKHEKHLRLYRRRFKAENMLRAYQRDTEPYRYIVDALQQPKVWTGSMGSTKNKLVLQAPFPCDMTTAIWDCLRVYRAENTVERVEALFHERQDEIAQKLLEWRTKAEDQLVKQYMSSFGGGTSQPLSTVLTIKGSTDATKDLSNNSRFLLRADAVFIRGMWGPYLNDRRGEADQEHGRICKSVHFPDIRELQNYPQITQFTWGYSTPELDKDLRFCARHSGKEAIVKALLRELEMPGAAHVELVHMGRVFVCGRCTWLEAME